MSSRIRVDATQKQNIVHPFMYGQFIEFLGRCINGGIHDPGSPLSDADGFRLDVLEKVRGLSPPLLRFPGGTMVKIYHWMDGIGPKEQRKRQANRIWGGVIDHAFGTDEFIQYCRRIGAEPFIVVNMATGTPEEAAAWVEYCNGTEDTYWANLRRSHGFDEPHNVKYWGLGNEEAAVPDIGQLHDPDEYVKAAWEFAKHMKLADRSIKLILPGDKPEWNRAILDELHPICDYLSLHYYANSRGDDGADYFRHVSLLEQLIADTSALLAEYPAKVDNFNRWYRFPPREREIQIALDEWGIWNLGNSDDYARDMETVYNWRDALLVAGMLNVMQRRSDTVTMATFAQMVNILAPILTDERGSFIQTIYHPLKLYRDHGGNRKIACVTESVTMPASAIPCLDASATYHDEREEIVVAVVNRDPSRPIRATVTFEGADVSAIAEIIELTCPSWETVNGFGLGDRVTRTVRTDVRYDAGGGYLFPPGSITLLKHRCPIRD